MELISAVDDALEQSQNAAADYYASIDGQQPNAAQSRQNASKGMPPRPGTAANQLSQSKSSSNLGATGQSHPQPSGYARNATMAALGQVRGNSLKNVPLASSAKKKLASGGARKSSEMLRDNKADQQQAYYKQGSGGQNLKKQGSHASSHSTLQP